ncbi:MAG: GNAT family N-acetyltransferase [Verrucomicrobiales bacterium]|jgi:ribosomal protein S18 acetylase RimI-like enzyme|nr:GNAT family N-acetyltransferase [Verrucomicrobiales bacterium]
MRIRRASAKDLGAIVGLNGMTRADRQRRQLVAQALRENSVYILDDGEIHGCAILRRNFFHRYFLEMLFVDEDYRRSGWGDKLLARAELIAMKSGELWTSTNRSNLSMRSLLRKHGFRRTGHIIGLDAGDAEIFYVKKQPDQAISCRRAADGGRGHGA